MKMDALLVRTVLTALVVSGLGYMILSPLYEEGAMRVIVPVLSTLDFAIAFAIWKRKPWLNKWLRPIAIGTLLVAIPFWGRSSQFHGSFATPMLIVETATVIVGTCLLLLSFRPAFQVRNSAG